MGEKGYILSDKSEDLPQYGHGLYSPANEHDACGVGMIVNLHGTKSHDLIDSALRVLENMKHRGAEGADSKTGDGAGIMIQIPHEFILLQGIPVPEKGKYGTGLVFMPKDKEEQHTIMSIMIEEIEREGMTLMHVRSVPVNSSVLGKDALATEPDVKQIFITAEADEQNLERKLYIIKEIIIKVYRLPICKRQNKCIRYDLDKCIGPCRKQIDDNIKHDIVKNIKESYLFCLF